MIKPRPINTLLRSGPVLKELRKNLEIQEKLLILTRSLLPEPLDQHCISVQQHCSNLIIHTDSSAWASRLRYFSRDLRTKLLKKGIQVKKIEVRVIISNQQQARQHVELTTFHKIMPS